MNQLYAEAGVKRKDTPLSLALKALMILGILLGVVLLFLGNLFIIVGAALIVVMFLLFPRMNIEYEYIFVDGQIDFDQITGKSKRKNLLTIDMEQVEMIAKRGSHALDSYTNIQCVNKDFTSRSKGAKPYILIASMGEIKYRVAFEPSETMITMMKQKSPRKVSME